MKTLLTRITVVLLSLNLLGMSPLYAQTSQQLQQKKKVEAEQAQVKQKLQQLKQQIERTAQNHKVTKEAVLSTTKNLQSTTQKLEKLNAQKKQAEQKLEELAQEENRLTHTLVTGRSELSNALVEFYQNPNGLSWPGVVNEDAHILWGKYLSLVGNAQIHALQRVQKKLDRVESTQDNVEKQHEEVAILADKTESQKNELKTKQVEQEKNLKKIASQLSVQQNQFKKLKADEERLGRLVDRLIQQITEAQRKKAQNAERAKSAKTNPNETDKAVNVNKTPQDSGENATLSKLKGKLHLPVRGTLLNRFGSARKDGLRWRGLFIKAPLGGSVYAIAPGRIVFAGELRGFGQLIIIDHGQQYLTVYANNQSLQKRLNDKVRAGDVIANVGNSGISEESGLYFEMRYQGKPIDPLPWVQF